MQNKGIFPNGHPGPIEIRMGINWWWNGVPAETRTSGRAVRRTSGQNLLKTALVLVYACEPIMSLL
jgi:hypothetical protein